MGYIKPTLGLCRNNGKEHGNYYSILGLYSVQDFGLQCYPRLYNGL